MSKVSSGKKQHTSMRGKRVDMDLLRKRNELTPAVGNARVNARGDELGSGGEITRKREAIVQEHYAQAGKARPDSGRAESPDNQTEVEQPATKLAPAKKSSKKSQSKVEQQLTTAEKEIEEQVNDEDNWAEDAKGNFVKKANDGH
jgi:hypothetical protein